MSPKHVYMSMLCLRSEGPQEQTPYEEGLGKKPCNNTMPRIERGVFNIRSVITRCRTVSQHRASSVNADN